MAAVFKKEFWKDDRCWIFRWNSEVSFPLIEEVHPNQSPESSSKFNFQDKIQ